MPYRALYREFRPKCFSDMVGQDHITSVLRNQIATGKTTHAYLLCGTRGTGKTTAARILARSLNCLEPVNGEACGRCEACLFSMSENCPDIVEIDAASNNGVDNVRDLIDNCNISPLKLTKRVVIIDEVHMLSASAFNALLKTLEEPPEHLVFILATTEPHKLLSTIVSRCQRFDFHRISTQDIIKNLTGILTKIGAAVEEEGLLQIARSANGGMRDALSLLDQCLSFCGDNLTTDDVFNVLGNMEESYMLSISAELLNCKADRAIIELDSVVQKGRDFNIFVNDLANVFRSLLILRTCGTGASEILDYSADTLKKYAAVAEGTSPSHLLMAMRQLLELQGSLKYSPAPRTLIETVFIRIAKPEKQNSIEALEARIDLLEKKLREGGFAAAAPSPVRLETGLPKNTITVSDTSTEIAKTEPQVIITPPNTPYEPVCALSGDDAVATHAEASQKTVSASPCAPSGVPSAAPPSSDLLSDCFSIWRSLLNSMMKELPLIYSLASKGVPLSISDNRLTVGFSEENTMAMNTCCAQRSQLKINSLMNAIIPGATVSFVKYSPQSVDMRTEQKLKDMFGDKLEITND